MSLERKVYVEWAFSENEQEKAEINREIHKELKSKYKVFRHGSKQILEDGVDVNFDDYDIIIGRSACYLHGEYTVYKNSPKLTDDELALLCDDGNLCFGYTMLGINRFYVFED